MAVNVCCLRLVVVHSACTRVIYSTPTRRLAYLLGRTQHVCAVVERKCRRFSTNGRAYFFYLLIRTGTRGAILVRAPVRLVSPERAQPTGLIGNAYGETYPTPTQMQGEHNVMYVRTILI